MIDSGQKMRIKEMFPSGALVENACLADYSFWQIGGNADLLVEPNSVESLASVISYLSSEKINYLVVGDGSNLLFDDAGFRGVVVKIGSALSQVSFEPDGVVKAQAGIWVPCFVRKVASHGLAGCQHAIGIPGRLGGLVMMNGGSQRKSISEQLLEVTVMDGNGVLSRLLKEECDFSYRYSRLQEMDVVVVEALFKYEQGDPGRLHQEMLEILRERRRKFPRKEPNCGSVFLSNPSMYETVGPPGKVIEEAGFKGQSRGGAMVSPRHANFIVNTGDAQARDVLYLIYHIRNKVHQKTEFWLDCEVKFVSQYGDVMPAHIAAEDFFK
jgi:UDP-N-acetylmuramate dehydrogenase